MSYHHWLTLGHFRIPDLLKTGWSVIRPVTPDEVCQLEHHLHLCFQSPGSLQKYLKPVGVISFSYFSELIIAGMTPREGNFGIGYLSHKVMGLAGVLTPYGRDVEHDQVMFPEPDLEPPDLSRMDQVMRRMHPQQSQDERRRQIEDSLQRARNEVELKSLIRRRVDEYVATLVTKRPRES
jgi:hypothetical protein